MITGSAPVKQEDAPVDPHHKAVLQARKDKKMVEDLKKLLQQTLEQLPLATPGTIKVVTVGYYGVNFFFYHSHLLPDGIKQLTLMTPERERLYGESAYSYAVLRAETQKGEIRYYNFENLEQYKAFTKYDNPLIRREDSHIRAANTESHTWDHETYQDIYYNRGQASKAVRELYYNLRPEFAMQIDTFLRMNPKIKKVRLIELGCGESGALESAAEKTVALLGRENVYCIGTDINETTLKISAQNWRRRYIAKVNFLKLGTTDAANFEEKLFQHKSPEYYDIVLASGHFSRLVLPGAHAMYKVFYRLIRGGVKTIFAASYTHALYSQYMLDQMGFHLTHNSYPVNHPRFPQSTDLITYTGRFASIERLKDDWLWEKPTIYLDLSFCTNLMRATNELSETKESKSTAPTPHPACAQVQYLDISYCDLSHYSSYYPVYLDMMLNLFPRLKAIIFHTDSYNELQVARESFRNRLNPTQVLLNAHTRDERIIGLPKDIYPLLHDKDQSLKAVTEIQQRLQYFEQKRKQLSNVSIFPQPKDWAAQEAKKTSMKKAL